MPIVPTEDLIQAINSTLTVPVRSHSAETPGYDVYEVYLFGICVEASAPAGFQVRFEDAFGNATNELILRTSPSSISSQAQPFTHAVLSRNGEDRLELHLGIYLRAGSGVSHEADIVIINAGEAARARALLTDPRSNAAAVIIEAKFYGSNVGLRTGREFLGLAADVGGDPPILVSSSPGGSAHRLLSYRKRSGHFELVPGSNQENELRAQVTTKLRDYLAKNS